MKLNDLKPGQFFEFTTPGYCFGRCMFIGLDYFHTSNFIHQSAALSRFILNGEIQERNPDVTIEVPQSFREMRPC
jgi:hypothetical protein